MSAWACFASGAAHELGTPLSTLAVILGDWKREPRVALDPVMQEDIEEMERQVSRCKRIVSDILLSVGETRGEALPRQRFGRLWMRWCGVAQLAHDRHADL
ncbi:MAG: histidine kinase dimerization/phospho-acceptor domain-containing protein [Burkholderiaceae bacterium]